MSIYPGGKPEGLSYKWQLAALDLPIPRDLRDQSDLFAWESYARCLSAFQQIRKLGQALDVFHDLMDKAQSVPVLSQTEKISIYSTWTATSVLAGEVHSRLDVTTEDRFKSCKSDIDVALYLLVDFLKGVNSPEAEIWSQRREKHNSIDDAKLLPLLSLTAITAKPTHPSI